MRGDEIPGMRNRMGASYTLMSQSWPGVAIGTGLVCLKESKKRAWGEKSIEERLKRMLVSVTGLMMGHSSADIPILPSIIYFFPGFTKLEKSRDCVQVEEKDLNGARLLGTQHHNGIKQANNIFSGALILSLLLLSLAGNTSRIV